MAERCAAESAAAMAIPGKTHRSDSTVSMPSPAAAAFLRRHDDAAVRAAFVPHDDAALRYRADLYALARSELARLGVQAVYGGGWCTHGSPQLFYSYRRDGVCGRMASLIWISP